MSPAPIKILAVDDNEDALFALQQTLEQAGYQAITASSGEEAYDRAVENPDLSLILLDVVMPKGNGYLITEKLKSDPQLRFIPVYLLSGKDSLEDIVKGLDRGADGYITKPYQMAELLARVRAALRLRDLYRQLERSEDLNARLLETVGRTVVGESAPMKAVYGLVERVATVDSPVLITGPTGSGKELIARSIHLNSLRSDKIFLAQNCAAMTEALAEAELFGFTRGSFTGAVRDKKGLFEAADGGTLFLDEVGELALPLQAKLLRVLQEGVFIPVGSIQERKVDVRLIAATNRNLLEMVEKGTFREDLYYRLNVFAIELPGLNARREDIPLLVEHFLERFAKSLGGRPRRVSDEAMQLLQGYAWRGNVRELQNEVERMWILGRDKEVLDVDVLSARLRENTATGADSDAGALRSALGEVERKLILEALARASGNKSVAAKDLGMSRSNLISKVKLYGLE